MCLTLPQTRFKSTLQVEVFNTPSPKVEDETAMTSDSKSDPSVQKIQFPRSSKSKLGQNGRFTRSHSFTFLETIELHFGTFTFFNNHNVAYAIVEHVFGRILNSWSVNDETLGDLRVLPDRR